jgi:hypothetical protein
MFIPQQWIGYEELFDNVDIHWVVLLLLPLGFKGSLAVRLYLQLFVGGLMSYLRYLCLFAYSGFQHILCCVFVFLVFVLCTLFSSCVPCFRLVYPMLPVSVDCPFVIAPSVFSNIYSHI